MDKEILAWLIFIPVMICLICRGFAKDKEKKEGSRSAGKPRRKYDPEHNTDDYINEYGSLPKYKITPPNVHPATRPKYSEKYGRHK